MNNIDWNEAPEWAVDVRRSPNHINCWTDGDEFVQVICPDNPLFEVGKRWPINVKDWPIIAVLPVPAQPAIDWNEAPEWAVDVRRSAGGDCWTDGIGLFAWLQGIDSKIEYRNRAVKDWPIIESRPVHVAPTPATNIERIASLITSWPTSIHSAEALAKANICSNICATWCGSELIRITLDGVTEDEWLEAVTLNEQDMIKLSGRAEMTRDEFAGRCILLHGIGPVTVHGFVHDLYDAGCRFVK